MEVNKMKPGINGIVEQFLDIRKLHPYSPDPLNEMKFLEKYGPLDENRKMPKSFKNSKIFKHAETMKPGGVLPAPEHAKVTYNTGVGLEKSIAISFRFY